MVRRFVEQHDIRAHQKNTASATRIFQPPESLPTSPSIISQAE